jgi:murein DD-endopeptidase MepM/ murein hydrolase activator NlpD
VRALLITPILALGIQAVTTTTAATSQLALTEMRAELAKAASQATSQMVDGARREVIEAGVRAQRVLRDAARVAGDQLFAITHLLDEHADVRIPDLGVLRVEPVEGSSSSGFGWRKDPIRHHRKFHNGADLRGKHGTPVLAAGDGVVILCGYQGGYGNVIFIDHGGGVVTRYAHLRKLETKKGAAVIAGQRIGQVGSTGRTTGPHLHFEVRLDGRAVDPVTAMAVAELSRVAPDEGRIAAYALTPELQSQKLSDLDPPTASPRPAAKTPRPERRDRVKRDKPLS